MLLQDVEGMMSISVEAAAARSSLEDNTELINTYEVDTPFWFDSFANLHDQSY